MTENTIKHLAILGASGHGKVIAESALLTKDWDEVSFFDDAWPNCQVNGQWQVIGDTETLLESHRSFQGIIVGIGNNLIRQDKQHLLLTQGAKLVSIVHPESFIGNSVKMGRGSVVFAKAAINVDSIIGDGCIINTGATVDHDCQLSEFSHVSPGVNLAGNVNIGLRSWIGVGASVIQGISIGNDVMVGAGATVISNVESSYTVVGVPARKI